MNLFDSEINKPFSQSQRRAALLQNSPADTGIRHEVFLKKVLATLIIIILFEVGSNNKLHPSHNFDGFLFPYSRYLGT